MTSIPADPTITLGNIIDPQKVEDLMTIAELQKPVDLANDRLNNLTRSTYKLKMIFNQMVNLKVPQGTLKKLSDEITELKKATGEAAADLAEATIQSEKDINDAKMAMSQKKISLSIESPMDWATSQLVPQPISYDALTFDIQYFSALSSKDTASASSSSSASTKTSQSSGEVTKRVTSYVRTWFWRTRAVTREVPDGTQSKTTSHAENMHKTSNQTSQESNVTGIIVIVASCIHKTADIFAPCILDARKSVAAWNYTFPDDRLGTDPKSISKEALSRDEGGKNKKVINLLTGCSRSSSFVGYCNILKTETSKTAEESESFASSFSEHVRRESFTKNLSGQTARSNSRSSSSSSAFSSSTFETSCSISCQGIIPSIVANESVQIVHGLAPGPAAIMGQMAAISDASTASTQAAGDMAAGASDAANGARFLELNSDHLRNSVDTLAEKAQQKNKTVDLVTMMTAFEDYVAQAKEGNCGVPTNYFIKQLTKADVAKVYARKFYPNGATTGKDAMAGQLGTEPTS